MKLAESQLRELIRTIILESTDAEAQEEESDSSEEPMGDESIKKVYSLAKEVSAFL